MISKEELKFADEVTKAFSTPPPQVDTRFHQQSIHRYSTVEEPDKMPNLAEEYAKDFAELAKPSGSKAAEILLTAATIVAGDRNSTHGEMERSFAVIAELWQTYLCGRKDRPIEVIDPVDVANMMVLLKIARSIQGTPVKDHYVDAAGYAAIAGELSGV